MRDLALLLGFVAILAPVFRYPHIGVLVWCWTALIVPNNFVYGAMLNIPFNKISAVLTFLVWVLSREPKKLPKSLTLVLLAAFGVLGTVSEYTGIADGPVGMVEWEKFIKILVFSMAIAGLITTKERIDALLYAIFLSLGFHGILEGAKFIASGGQHHVWGPAGSILGDNNHFALGMVALLPIAFYLYKQASSRWLKLVFIGSSLLVMASIMGTFSRGGLIGIAGVAVYALFKSGKRVRYVLVIIPLLASAALFAPDRWSNRMDTIATASQDDSFMGRVIAWKQSTLIAMDHPIFGGGFHAVQNFEVWTHYARSFDKLNVIPTPPPDPNGPHAAHSIYFQVLGDLGFVGLLLFLAILVSSWRNASTVIRLARERPQWRWASDLATSLQYSLIAYIVSGAALSMAYFDYMYMIFSLLIVMRHMVSKSETLHVVAPIARSR
jgi:probable O-glycosylation ligase (exosortase A-associated)